MIKIKITKQSVKTYFCTAWRELAVIAAVLFLDLLSKHLVSKFMKLRDKIVLIPKFLNFEYTKNPLAAVGFDFFGLSEKLGEEGMRIFFIIFILITTLGFMVFLIAGHKNRFFYRLPWALIIGGALGNLYDRIFHGAVRDFIQVEYFGKTFFKGTELEATAFPTFNLADSALVIGVIVFFIYFIFFYFRDEKKKEAERKALEAAEAGEFTAVCEDGEAAFAEASANVAEDIARDTADNTIESFEDKPAGNTDSAGNTD